MTVYGETIVLHCGNLPLVLPIGCAPIISLKTTGKRTTSS
jgi:hypothetical protein